MKHVVRSYPAAASRMRGPGDVCDVYVRVFFATRVCEYCALSRTRSRFLPPFVSVIGTGIVVPVIGLYCRTEIDV